MVHSMTAFARVEQAGTHGTLSWELRSVNHRYLEPHLRLPDAFRDLEGAVREALRQGLSRGKVECTLRFAEETAGKSLQVDQERARQLVAAAEGVAALIRQTAPLDPLAVLAWPGVLVADSADPQALNAAALEAFGQALEQLKAGRSREGQELAKLLNDRLDAMLVEVGNLRELVPTMLANQRQKILDRFAELKAELDPQRLEQELVLLAQKSDVAEELDRLATHVGEVRRVLKGGGGAGAGVGEMG
ncbi:YicC/YloC family endoribonuclease, partial [Pseudomonas aeruginosa]|uniref:YicC/YloC family endoribonuclease n=1 Tax=Pseudomonas aeruginosa TaxID=287 RepID=UPI003015142A